MTRSGRFASVSKRAGLGALGALAALAATAWGLSVSVLASSPRAASPETGDVTETGRTEVLAFAAWGEGPADAGLTVDGETRGPLSFGADDRDRVWLLDQEHGRLLRFDAGVITARVALPPGAWEDISVDRDRVCVLAREGERCVLVLDGDGTLLTRFPVPPGLPPVLHVVIDGGLVTVECPGEDARTYHVVGSLDPLAPATDPQATAPYRDAPVRGGGRASARLESGGGLAVDVRNSSGHRTRIRHRGGPAVSALLDVSGDARGGLYVTSVLQPPTSDAGGGGGEPVLRVSHHAPDGELIASARTAYRPFTDALRRVVVTESGRVLRLDSSPAGIAVVAWELTPSGEGGSR